MKRVTLILMLAVLAGLLTDASGGGRARTIRFDDLPLGVLAPGDYRVGDFIIKPFGYGDPVLVVDLGDGRRGLADANSTNGAGAGVSIFPAPPRSTIRVSSVSVRSNRPGDGDVRLHGQWSMEFEHFTPASAEEILLPAFAGEDIAFLNVTLYGDGDDHRLVLASVDVATSKAVEAGGTEWTTQQKDRLKVAGFRNDRWRPSGQIYFPVDGTWTMREGSGAGGVPDLTGDCLRKSKKTFHLVLDDARRAELEAFCRARFAASTGEDALFAVKSVVGKATINSKRTKINSRIDILGTTSGDFGLRIFHLRLQGRGIRPN